MSEKSTDSFGFGLSLIKLSNSIVEEEKEAFPSASLGSPAGANKLDWSTHARAHTHKD